ncbi:DUF7835 family putative zinc beta-ribbon protein [Haladaptatus halobius]|uniref:DUF7835 family putative zinc beta-ribbon protein n=1 Tax=Haladaptatus halobius TaxID=2884875 RepID=UPI003F6193D7
MESVEACEQCLRETPHQVSIELHTESPKNTNSEFSHEPYRVTTCLECGETTSQRVNNA